MISEEHPLVDDSVFKSAEFEEYEREFRRYTDENLRSQQPDQDFVTELCDDADTLCAKVNQLTAWWQEAERIVVFTGAGISTSAGLPDYRGPKGVWTRKVQGESVADNFDLDNVRPALSHEVLARLHRAGQLDFLATTNVDGLHTKAGLPPEAVAELHGNCFMEECRQCKRKFERAFQVRTAVGLFEHATGRSCEECSGPLRDNLVNFGNTAEHVPSMEAEHDRAWVQCLKADLVVVLGSSLSVQTACDLPEECLAPRDSKPEGGRLVIVNLQRTPKDPLASLRIFAACDDVMAPLEKALLGGTLDGP
mmetsp:Transcript_75173/g.220369  ORF Transcript_75173/g.220369 Transcript_75173/m.220369 type:complete len:308 (+) Transcript_75173:76-999(+)